MIFDAWTEQLARFLLVLARVAGIFSIAPVLGQHQVPGQVRIILAAALALAIAPIAPMPDPGVLSGNLQFVLAAVREGMVGLAIGFIAQLVVSAVIIAGEMIDYQMGFGLSGSVDPITNVQMPTIAKFLQMVVTIVFLVVGAHHFLIKALADSFLIIGTGESVNFGAAAMPVWDLFMQVFLTGLKVAAPIVGVLLLCDLALGLAARTTPQMNLLMVGFPIKMGVGILAMLVALPIFHAVMGSMTANLYGDVMVVVRALGK